ncbi:hypothetical protein C440_02433 [Haloferax mucosum ATCC BAA-1512]|uniref:DUF4013 domain-containing protein n=1 Tax=Haloferax mucosum ATCC BAA-1512 TaxID=662479 RepID=M0IQH5_9EURY|nr:DUF4013 domain-containing protein [Haloferax mucosum]ELZ98068.1 hypothetical protein C440_02433 [Haloferax mucosum ATCC BAA-1512]
MTRTLEIASYPLRGGHRADALAAVWALLLAHGILPFVPLVTVVGILVRVLAASADGSDGPPSVVRDVTGLLRQSVEAGIVALAYTGPPIAYLLVVLRVVSAAGGAAESSLLVLVAATVGGIMVLVSAYLLPVALVSYASSTDIRAAFDRSRLRLGARSGRYLMGWLAGIVVLDVGVLAAAWLGGDSAIRAVVGTLVAAYALLVAARLIGLGLAGSTVATPTASQSAESAE